MHRGKTFPEQQPLPVLLETFLLSLQIRTPLFNTLLTAPRNVMFNSVLWPGRLPSLEGSFGLG